MNPYLDLRGRERRKTKEGEREGKRGDGDPLQFKIVPRAHEHAAGYALSLSPKLLLHDRSTSYNHKLRRSYMPRYKLTGFHGRYHALQFSSAPRLTDYRYRSLKPKCIRHVSP